MHKLTFLKAVMVLTVGVVAVGCSTFEVFDAYKPIDNTGLLNYKQDDVELRLGINPDDRFYSIGVLGIPAIPITPKPQPQERLCWKSASHWGMSAISRSRGTHA
jgi:hypothetical protein